MLIASARVPCRGRSTPSTSGADLRWSRSIFINHILGIYFSNFTHARYSLSDSADLFVFLAGWSVRLLVGSGDRLMPTKHVVFRLGGRVLQIYAAQVLIAMLAIAMLAAAAMVLANPLLLEWHNAASVFYDPVPT